MRYLLFSLSSFLLFSCASNSILEKNARLVEISDQFSFTEGPAADKQGNVFFTDQPNDQILKWSVETGKVTLWMEHTGRANGLYFDDHGNLIACADEHSELWKINRNKKVNILFNNLNGKRLNGPNDLWIDSRGGIYFTDPYYQRDYWKRSEPELKGENVYYLSPDANTVKIVANGLVRPNGIIGSSEENILYVADIGDGKTYAYDIEENADLSHRRLFVNMGSDGMTIDEKGNVYLTGDGVTVFDRNGKQLHHIKIDREWTSNVTFGGKDHSNLFITAMNSLFKLDMKVKGNRY